MSEQVQQSMPERAKSVMTPNYRPAPVVFSRGEGAHLYAEDGRRFLDFTAGIAVCCLGHGHAGLARAISEQARDLLHVSNLYLNRPSIELAERLTSVCFADNVYFANSGAEANEAAMKLARRYQQLIKGENRFKIVAPTKSFHGRTWAAISATGQPKYHKGFAPLVEGFVHVPYDDLPAMEAVVDGDTCAVLVEPIQGEGGVVAPSPGYLQGLRDLCDRHGALLIFDEVQTGVARTGHWFAHQHEGVEPDIMSLAKGLGGGVPIGAMLTTAEVGRGFEPGAHASTYGGNPLVCAAARTVFDTIVEEGLMEHVREMGAHMAEGLASIVDEFEPVLEVRGRGLMCGLGVDADALDRAAVMTQARENGLLITTAGPDALRLVPPLIVGSGHIDEAVAILKKSIKEVLA